MEEEEYPEWFDSDDNIADSFEYQKVDIGTYAEDFKEAQKIVKKKGGVVYTMIDGEGESIVYEKGLHFVNRIGIFILKRID